MRYDPNRALELLRAGTRNPAAQFRDGQQAAIRHLCEGRGRLLVVQKTGWGKSSVYFIAAKLLREQGLGPTLLVSPLLALMRNQIAAAGRIGVRAETINSENQAEWETIESKLAGDEVDVLLISPERLGNASFMQGILAHVAARISLLVIDEAHCISDWGHDFRPHYRLIERMVRSLPANLRLLGTTATANDRVMQDLHAVLGPNLTVVRGDLARPSLFLQTLHLPGQAERLAWLAERLPQLNGSGIVYTLTVRDAEVVAAWLQSKGLNVEAYTGQSGERRAELEDALLANRVKALVATTALGMGYDKPDLAFVVHYQAPGSVVAYYQQVGRAGRSLKAAYGVLLSGAEEEGINDFFIENAFPTRDEVRQVISALDAAVDGLSVPELMKRVNVTFGRITKTLQLLSLESPAPVVKDGAKWVLTSADLSPSFWARADRLTDLRRAEQRQMQEYIGLGSGHMEFLIRALDGTSGPFQPPGLPPLSKSVSSALVAEAVAFLRRTSLPIPPRAVWPAGGLQQLNVKGRIAEDGTCEPGRVLCVWGDAGWGELVRRGKYADGRFADDLVTACVSLFHAWKPNPRPLWVTAIPSRRHPNLVPDFARRVARRLNLPYADVLACAHERPEQKSMANSVQQARNVDGALTLVATCRTGPVLLIDDMVDSRWTLTVAGFLLRKAGSGPVFPLALASTAHHDE